MEDWIIIDKDDINIGNSVWVSCVAEIRENITGEIREYETDGILEVGDGYPSTYNWEEGNYGCDCNRRIFFKRIKNELTEEDWNAECTTGSYSVNLKNKKDGKVYYREFNV